MATGGLRQKKALNTIEVFDPKKPKVRLPDWLHNFLLPFCHQAGWKKLAKLKMPAAVSDHCAVTLKTRKGKEVVITGGRGREKRVMKLDVKTQKW